MESYDRADSQVAARFPNELIILAGVVVEKVLLNKVRCFSLLLPVGISVGLSIFMAAWLRTPDFPLDDAYIVQHSVLGVLRGYEDRFLGATPMQGATSPFHILLVVCLALFMSVPWAQLVSVSLGVAWFLIGIYRLGCKAGLRWYWCTIVATLAATSGMTLYHLYNGLETGLAMASVTWALLWFNKPEPDKRYHFSLLGLLPFVRPELGLLTVLLALRGIWPKAWGRDYSGAVRAIGWIIAGAVLAMAFLYLTAGTIFPSTVAAKAFFFAEGCRPNNRKLLLSANAIYSFMLQIGPLTIGFVLLGMARVRWPAFAFIALFLAAYFIRLPGALSHNWGRYLYVLTPFALAGWVTWLSAENPRFRRAAFPLLALSLAASLFTLQYSWKQYKEGIRISRVELAGVCKWIRTNVPPKETLLIHDAGYISEAVPNPLVDLVGLKTSSSVRTHKQYTWATCARDARAIHVIALQSTARYLIVEKEWNRIFRLSSSLIKMGWRVRRVDQSRGDARYMVLHITPPAEDN